jgi:hypothetical protein
MRVLMVLHVGFARGVDDTVDRVLATDNIDRAGKLLLDRLNILRTLLFSFEGMRLLPCRALVGGIVHGARVGEGPRQTCRLERLEQTVVPCGGVIFVLGLLDLRLGDDAANARQRRGQIRHPVVDEPRPAIVSMRGKG